MPVVSRTTVHPGKFRSSARRNRGSYATRAARRAAGRALIAIAADIEPRRPILPHALHLQPQRRALSPPHPAPAAQRCARSTTDASGTCCIRRKSNTSRPPDQRQRRHPRPRPPRAILRESPTSIVPSDSGVISRIVRPSTSVQAVTPGTLHLCRIRRASMERGRLVPSGSGSAFARPRRDFPLAREPLRA